MDGENVKFGEFRPNNFTTISRLKRSSCTRLAVDVSRPVNRHGHPQSHTATANGFFDGGCLRNRKAGRRRQRGHQRRARVTRTMERLVTHPEVDVALAPRQHQLAGAGRGGAGLQATRPTGLLRGRLAGRWARSLPWQACHGEERVVINIVIKTAVLIIIGTITLFETSSMIIIVVVDNAIIVVTVISITTISATIMIIITIEIV